MVIGVVIVTYNASEVILDCLESLLASTDADIRIVVVDNASTDDTVSVIQDWAKNPAIWAQAGDTYFTAVPHEAIDLVTTVPTAGSSEIALLQSPVNKGFAGGVNIGLRLLKADPEVNYFWVLNPDCIAENQTAALLLAYAQKAGSFGVMGGRIFYKNPHLMIQSDGGRINFLTGICIPYNLGKIGRDVPAPASTELNYISGSHMLVSRLFLDQAGLMPEDYFLYYEEIDWCCRRGNLPMLYCPDAVVHHDGGHTLGSATLNRGPSPIAAYFMGRSRMRFMRRYRPAAFPVAFTHAFAKAVKLLLKGQISSGIALLRGISGIRPSRTVREQLKPQLHKD